VRIGNLAAWFDLQSRIDTITGMIAVAKDFDVAKEMMTVQQVMDAIGARAPSTITRLIKAKRLRATRIGSMGWLVYRESVDELLDQERKSGPSVGFPRGGVRAADAEPALRKKAKPRKSRKKSKPD
jgi:excisionase family DNA binding protein